MQPVDQSPTKRIVNEVSKEQLTQLFDGDWIRANASNEQLLRWGRYEGLFKTLKTDSKKGIDTNPQSLDQRRRLYDSNTPVRRIATTLWQFIIDTFEDPMLRVLCLAALVSLVLGIATDGIEEGWLEGTSILVAICLIVSVTSINNYLKEQQFNKLNDIATRKDVNVVREGKVQGVSVYDLLVGDLVKVETGEIMSVDGILTDCQDISMDEASMTGESLTIHKSIPVNFSKEEAANPYMISGSRVLTGTGEIVVLAVGVNSQYGRIQAKLSMPQDETPLQQKLEILAENIGKIGVVSATLTFIAMMVHLIIQIALSEDWRSYLTLETVRTIVEYFTIAISIIVVAVPEGLPLAVTIALAYSVGKMKDENNLVRYLAACETMGGANNICTDKTGTLTKNSMEVLRVFTGGSVYEVENKNIPKPFQERFSIGCCLNSNAYPRISQFGNFEMSGSKTECALLQLAYTFGFDYRQIRSEEYCRIVKYYPFSSDIKRMAVVYSKDGQQVLALKGAPEMTFEHCVEYLAEDGSKKKIDAEFRNKMQEAISLFSEATLRTLLIAEKFADDVEAASPLVKVENGLTFIGLVGIRDPLRPEIKRSVKTCKEAGITVRMLTGDNESTAIAIAKEAGILSPAWRHGQRGEEYAVMQGKDFRNFVGGVAKDPEGKDFVKNMQNFKKVAQQLCVLARCSPQDKYIMATGLKQLNNVVAMTGDGTNDAPALKKADIGFAMGITGTEVAKEAAGIILLDDNFASIVTAIKWGRNIIECIRKFLQFQLTVNAVALFIAFIGSVVLKESPLNPIQMLWVNLIMDTFASLALATEPPSEDLLLRKPYSRFENLITPTMWKNVIMQALLQIIILGTVLFAGPRIFGITSSVGLEHSQWNDETGRHYSIFFNTFVMLQLFNEINSRKLKNEQLNVFKDFTNNKLFILILLLTFGVQFLLISFGGRYLRVTPLTIQQHLICVGLGSTSLLFGFLIKLVGPPGFNVRIRKPSAAEQQHQD